MTANSLLFVKSHVNSFTRKDGTFVAAHDDKRQASAITAAQGNDKPVKRVVDSIKKNNKNAAAGLKDTIASDFSKGDISTGDGADMTYGKFNDHLASMRTQLGNDPAHSEHLKHAQFALLQTSGGGGGSSAPIKEKHAKLYGAALSGKTKIDDDGMVRHAAEPVTYASLKKHPQFGQGDFDHMKKKGYTPDEIKKFWDRDQADGEKPIHGNPKPTNKVGVYDQAAIMRQLKNSNKDT